MSNAPDDTQGNRSPRTNSNPEQREATSRRSRTRVDTDTLRWLSGIVSLIGLWIAVSPFLYGSTQVALWNNLAVGAAIFLIAGYNYYRMTNGYRPSVGTSSLVVVLGLWAVIAPFLLDYGPDFGGNALAWSTMASGITAALLSGYNAYEGRRAESRRAARTRV